MSITNKSIHYSIKKSIGLYFILPLISVFLMLVFCMPHSSLTDLLMLIGMLMLIGTPI